MREEPVAAARATAAAAMVVVQGTVSTAKTRTRSPNPHWPDHISSCESKCYPAPYMARCLYWAQSSLGRVNTMAQTRSLDWVWEGTRYHLPMSIAGWMRG